MTDIIVPYINLKILQKAFHDREHNIKRMSASNPIRILSAGRLCISDRRAISSSASVAVESTTSARSYKSGLRYLSIHSFRHLNASLLITNDVDVRTVSASLGHSLQVRHLIFTITYLKRFKDRPRTLWPMHFHLRKQKSHKISGYHLLWVSAVLFVTAKLRTAQMWQRKSCPQQRPKTTNSCAYLKSTLTARTSVIIRSPSFRWRLLATKIVALCRFCRLERYRAICEVQVAAHGEFGRRCDCRVQSI